MKMQVIPLGAYQTNCYILIDEETNRCVLVDPGNQGQDLVQYLQKADLHPEAVLLTHGHADHIGAVQAVVDHFNIPLYLHEEDVPMLTSSQLNLSAKMGEHVIVQKEPILVNEGDELTFTCGTFTVIETPGHTPGGVCYYGEGILLAGDTLFNGSIGRTDFPGGSFEILINHIKNKLYELPPNTVVYPGHGPHTTIGQEIDGNPFTM